MASIKTILKNTTVAGRYLREVAKQRRTNVTRYNLAFNREENNCWYIDLPEWQGSHGSLQMVAGADTLCALLSEDGENTSVEVINSNEYDESYKEQGYVVLRRTEWGLTSGAFYDVENIDGLQKLWL